MRPLAAVCNMHGSWLTSVATRTLAGARHAGNFGDVLQSFAATPAMLDKEPVCTGDALWLPNICIARTDRSSPWGKTQPSDLIRIANAVAHQVISAPNFDERVCGLSADRRALVVKDFAVKTTAGQRSVTSLPTRLLRRLRQRQWVLARAAHYLAIGPKARTLHSSWSTASVKRLALMHG